MIAELIKFPVKVVGSEIYDVTDNWIFEINVTAVAEPDAEIGKFIAAAMNEKAERESGSEAMEIALAESVKLQSHYATLLNMHDGGQRLIFKDADAWISRLREVGIVTVKQRTPVCEKY